MNKIGAKGLRLFNSRAAEYIKDKSKVSTLLNLALHKGASTDAFKDVWERLQLFINILKDWVRGEYKEIPKRSLIILTGALLYFVTPADLVPDFIPLSGYLDDVTVLSFAYSQIKKDLDRYKMWKAASAESNSKEAFEKEEEWSSSKENKQEQDSR